MDNFSEKHIVIIASAGRTGTKFFGEIFKSTIQNSFSVHEPDLLTLNLKDLITKIKLFGFYNLVLGKIFGKTGVRILSEKYISKKISGSKAIKLIFDLRKKYYLKISQDLIIESYYAWYGIIPLLDKVFKNIKVVGVIRDPRDWVTSNMNWGTQYGSRDYASKLGFNRITPVSLGIMNKNKWRGKTVFEKLCWEWKLIYKSISDSNNLEYVKIYRYEDLFIGENRYNKLINLLEFITKTPNKTFKYKVPEGILDKKIHKNISYDFPQWTEWSKEHSMLLESICGDLMKKYNYGNELQWQEKIQKI